MATRRKLTIEEANQEMQNLAASGTKVYDLRGKSQDEQITIIQEIKAGIAQLLEFRGLAKDFPLTFVAGSGKTNDPGILTEAREMGDDLQAIINGGSQYSVMGATADGAKVKIGITCDLVLPFELPDSRYDMVIIADGKGFKGLEKRLQLTRALTAKELAIHGGMGTLEEVLGGLKVREELSLLVPYWTPLIDTLKKDYELGIIDQQELDRIHPVSPKGTPIDALSTTVSPSPSANEFKTNVARIVNSSKNILQQHKMGKGHVLDHQVPLKGVMADSDFFVLPPADIQTLHQAIMIMCEKRIDMMFGDKAPTPGIAKKPLIVLNVDGIYDGFIQQWQQMEKGGFLTEKLSDLLTEVKIDSHAQEQDIRERLAFIAAKKPVSAVEAISENNLNQIRQHG